jgi:uncharacterized protein (TIGR00730 family)
MRTNSTGLVQVLFLKEFVLKNLLANVGQLLNEAREQISKLSIQPLLDAKTLYAAMTKKVCVFGSYKDVTPQTKQEIVRLGKMLAERGITVMSGGFGGTMEDISRGAKSAGGKTVGVTCYPWGKERDKRANEFVDEEIVAKDFHERIAIMLGEADAFVVFPGGTGTLMELAAALEYVNKGLMEPKPIVLLGSFWKPVVSCLQTEPVFSKKLTGRAACCAELVTFAETADDCIKQIT